jgi:molecular chaperone DnaK
VSGRLEFHKDPLTVVARGAAVFAGTQRLEAVAAAAPTAGTYVARLEYKPIGADTEPLVGGVIQVSGGGDLAGFTVEFVNGEARPEWRSGRITLAHNGSFMSTLWAEKGRANTFSIELTDARGTPQKVEPDRLTYTVGNVFSDVPLPHSVGVALADNSIAEFFRKGDALPARGRLTLHTAYDAQAGGSSTVRIPFIEGLSSRADRNADFGVIVIAESGLVRSVPAGSEVEVTLEIDASRTVRAEVYVPLVDETFEARYDYENYRERSRDPAALASQIAREKARLSELREKAYETGDANAHEAIRTVDDQQLVHEVDSAAVAMQADQSAAGRCEQKLRDLQQALDGAEDALRWPALTAEAEDAIRFAQRVVDDFGEADDRQRFQLLRDQVREAMQSADKALLEQRVLELRGFACMVLEQRGILQQMWLDSLKDKVPEMADQARARELVTRADRAVQTGDVEGLRAVNRQLEQLLPSPLPPPDGSWLMR